MNVFLETTSSKFGIIAYSKFLQDNGITNDGVWQREFLSYIPYGILWFLSFSDCYESATNINVSAISVYMA